MAGERFENGIHEERFENPWPGNDVGWINPYSIAVNVRNGDRVWTIFCALTLLLSVSVCCHVFSPMPSFLPVSSFIFTS